MIEQPAVVEETRSDINRKHDLVDVMFLVINAIISGIEGWSDIEIYGDAKVHGLSQYQPFANGIPCRHSITRILSCIVINTCWKLCCVGLMNCTPTKANQ